MRGFGNLGSDGPNCAGQAMTKAVIDNGQYIPPSYLDNLKQHRDSFQSRLDNINRLISALEIHPEFVEIIDLSNRI